MENSIDQNSLKELTAFIEQSSLGDEDKQLWIKTIPYVGETVAGDLINYLREYPEKIGWATDMLKQKTSAIKNNDDAIWNQILMDEESELKNILDKE